jgi:hypothetical protein
MYKDGVFIIYDFQMVFHGIKKAIVTLDGICGKKKIF